MKRHLIIIAANVLMAGSGFAQQPAPMPGMDMKGMDAKMMMPSANDTPSTKAYKLAMMHAMQTMPSISGEADADFMKQMRPHHEAAIEMAKVVIAKGKDATVKKLA
jgi:uncharacterized protein (DUF305 family)